MINIHFLRGFLFGGIFTLGFFLFMSIITDAHAETPVKQTISFLMPSMSEARIVLNDDDTCYIHHKIDNPEIILSDCLVSYLTINETNDTISFSYKQNGEDRGSSILFSLLDDYDENYGQITEPTCFENYAYCYTQEDCEMNAYYWWSGGYCNSVPEGIQGDDAVILLGQIVEGQNMIIYSLTEIKDKIDGAMQYLTWFIAFLFWTVAIFSLIKMIIWWTL